MRHALDDTLTWIQTNPGTFIQLTLQRIIHFWFGPLHRPWKAAGISALTILALIGAWKVVPKINLPQRAALLIPLATFPIIYYLVPYMARYRVTIDWIIYLLGAAAIWHWIELSVQVQTPSQETR